jgi:hypothetical protein
VRAYYGTPETSFTTYGEVPASPDIMTVAGTEISVADIAIIAAMKAAVLHERGAAGLHRYQSLLLAALDRKPGSNQEMLLVDTVCARQATGASREGMTTVGDVKDWLKAGHWPNLSRLLDDDKTIASLFAGEHLTKSTRCFIFCVQRIPRAGARMGTRTSFC